MHVKIYLEFLLFISTQMKAMLPSTDSISNNPSTTHTASNTVGMLLFFSVFDGSYSDQKWMFVYYSSIESSEQQFIREHGSVSLCRDGLHDHDLL